MLAVNYSHIPCQIYVTTVASIFISIRRNLFIFCLFAAKDQLCRTFIDFGIKITSNMNNFLHLCIFRSGISKICMKMKMNGNNVWQVNEHLKWFDFYWARITFSTLCASYNDIAIYTHIYGYFCLQNIVNKWAMYCCLLSSVSFASNCLQCVYLIVCRWNLNF